MLRKIIQPPVLVRIGSKNIPDLLAPLKIKPPPLSLSVFSPHPPANKTKKKREILTPAKNYAIGEPTNKEDRRNLKNVKRQKCKLIAVVEVLGFLGSPILNMIYPGEVSRDVEICLDILIDKYLPMFQDKQKGE